jgi:hypothetical protein
MAELSLQDGGTIDLKKEWVTIKSLRLFGSMGHID